MARIRSIKPSLWTDEALAQCSPIARLLFIASLNFAEDSGCLERSARQLKAQAFPYDSIDCEPLILELMRVGLLIEYKVGDRKYLHIKGFLAHQRIDRPSKCSLPVYEPSLSTRQTLDEPSTSTRSGREGKGRKGEEGKGTTSARKTAPSEPDWLRDLKMLYPERAGNPNWPGALTAGNARLKEGHTSDQILDGARRYQAFCRVTGKIRTEFVLQAATFLGRGKPFLEPWNIPPPKAGNLREASICDTADWVPPELRNAKH